jgi:predicted PurR-regulated permease PerM
VAAQVAWRVVVVLVALGALLWLVGYFSVLVIPLLVAVLLTALVIPLTELLVRLRLPRGLAVAVTLLTLVAAVAGLFTLVGTQIASGLAGLGEKATDGFFQVQDWMADGPLNLSSAQVDAYLDQAREQLTANSEEIASQALTITATAGEVVTGAFLVFFSMIFLLLQGERIWGWLVHLLPVPTHEKVDAAGRAGWSTLTSYVRATVLVATVDAVGIGLGAALLGVPLAIPLAVLVFLGAFVPIVGAFVSGGVAVLVALVALGPVQALIMLGVVVLVQQLESHVLQPFLLGRAVAVHPLAVVLAIGAGLIVAGVVGALFSVPLVAFLNTAIHSLRGRKDPMVAELVRPELRVDLRRHTERVRRRRRPAGATAVSALPPDGKSGSSGG